VLEPFFRIHDARYMMYWNATVYTSTGDALQQKPPATIGIRLAKGGMIVSFTTTDPSRHILLYTLAGKRIADVSASARTVTLNYLTQGIMMKNGMYAVQVLSRGNRVSKALFITAGHDSIY
jgi:hypothetical protein